MNWLLLHDNAQSDTSFSLLTRNNMTVDPTHLTFLFSLIEDKTERPPF
jgi:hypothetical protein